MTADRSPPIKSTKTVAPGGPTTVNDPDGADASPEAKRQAALQKAREEAAREANGQISAEAKKQAEFEKAHAEKDGDLSATQAREIEKALGDEPENDPENKAENEKQGYLHVTDPDPVRENGVTVMKDPPRNPNAVDHTPGLPDAFVAASAKGGTALRNRFENFHSSYRTAKDIVTSMVRDIPDDTPDDFILYGAAGHTLRLGHLRSLITGHGDASAE